MSVKVSTAVWHDSRFSELKGNAMLAMLALADVAGDDGAVTFAKGAKRSQESLARKARMSVATFRRMTQELAGLGLLEISRESQRTENEYRVLVTAQPERSDGMTAQFERSGVSGQDAEFERSERSPVSGHSSIDVLNVTTDVGGAQKRAARIPEPFIVTAAMRVWAASETPGVDVDRSTRMFVDYWRAESGAKAAKRDWVATWRNWLRRDAQPARSRGHQSKDDRALKVVEMGRELAGEGSKAIAS